MEFNESRQTLADAMRTTNHEGGEPFEPADPRLALYKRLGRLPRGLTPGYVHLIDLTSYGDLVAPGGYEDVYNIFGWSENVLNFIEHTEVRTGPRRDRRV